MHYDLANGQRNKSTTIQFTTVQLVDLVMAYPRTPIARRGHPSRGTPLLYLLPQSIITRRHFTLPSTNSLNPCVMSADGCAQDEQESADIWRQDGPRDARMDDVDQVASREVK